MADILTSYNCKGVYLYTLNYQKDILDDHFCAIEMDKSKFQMKY